MRKSVLLAVPLGPAALSGPALAGPATKRAQAHFAAIAKGDVAAVTAMTAPNATLHWVGGPLDGTYAGADAQKPVWTKFATAQGEQKTTVSNLNEAADPKGATVTANVVFAGKNAVKVRYVLLYTDGKLVDEVWQVDGGVLSVSRSERGLTFAVSAKADWASLLRVAQTVSRQLEAEPEEVRPRL